ncbi:Basic-leucine zipper domain containing protein [Globisporangium polare]
MNTSNNTPDCSCADLPYIAEELCTIEPIPFLRSCSSTSWTRYANNASSLKELFLSVHTNYDPQTPQQPSQPGQIHSDIHLGVFMASASGKHWYTNGSTISHESSEANTAIPKPALSKEEARRRKNRESAAKSRQRAHETICALEDALAAVQQRNAFLKSELERLSVLRFEQRHRALTHYASS